jgi:hypothetical protein
MYTDEFHGFGDSDVNSSLPNNNGSLPELQEESYDYKSVTSPGAPSGSFSRMMFHNNLPPQPTQQPRFPPPNASNTRPSGQAGGPPAQV